MYKFCTHCGAKMPNENAFCTHCGTKFTKCERKKPLNLFMEI